MQINETRTPPHTMHENKLKMAQRLKDKTRHHQTPGKRTQAKHSLTSTLQMFSQVSLQSNRNKSKNKPMGPNEMEKLLHSKGNLKETKTTTYRMGENSFKQYN